MSEPSRMPAAAHSAQVLVVDDQPANLLAISELLRPLAVQLAAARSGQEALRLLLDQDFALVLLDVRMPDLDGFETARLIRARDKTRDTPIIFLTAYDRDDREMQQGYELGAVDFLAKPVVPEVLRAKVGFFVELHGKTEQIRRQAELIRETQRNEHAALLAQERQRWEMERLRDEAAREKKTAEKLADIVAERTRAELLMRQRAQQHALIAAFGQLALAGADLDHLFRDIVRQVAQALAVEFCVILELLPDGLLQLRAGVGWQDDRQEFQDITDWSDTEAFYALKLDHSVVVSDLRAETRFDGASLLKHGVVSGLTVLIRNQQRPFGVFGAHCRRERVFTQDDVNFLQAIANVLAAAIQRRRSEQELSSLKDQLADQLADMIRLHKLSGQLLNSLNLQAMIIEVLQAITQLQETDVGVLLLNDPEEPTRHTMVSVGLGDESPRQGQVPADWSETAVSGDIQADPRFAPYLPALQQMGPRTLHTTPLRIRAGRTIGAVTAFFPPERQPSENQLRLVELYARQAAEAIDNARLHQEIQAANRRKDEFLAVMAHELRNPLAPLRNALEILRIQPEPGPIRDRARDMAERQVNHMTRLVDDLLDVSRISRGKIQLSQKPVELAAVLHRAVESTRPLFEGHAIHLDLLAADEPVWLHADPTRLEQILINLLNNAAKYTPAGGRVWVSLEPGVESVAVRVRDTGIGIAADLLPHIFDMFVQAEGALDRSQGGLGIGLTLVQNLVRLHGGTIEAHSAGPGQGSEFVVRLPRLRESPPAANGQPVLAAEASSTCRILVVDDNVDAAESLAFLLRSEGHDVVTAYDGLAALEQVRAAIPDVVLLDIGLPGMNGHEVAGHLRRQHAHSVKLVAMTGYGQDDDRRRSQEAGIDAHLTKPVDLQELQKLLRQFQEAG